ncbi:MAG: replication factor C large subunit [Archaeoglobales archaeon]|nr:replication factor C large subunit [Archaeoglobales archaeon]
MLWVEKYRPKNLKEVVTTRDIVERILQWANKWKNGEYVKPLLLAGPPGVGKTSLALALANTMGWEFVELNASDQRSFEVIQKIVGEGAFNETISDEGEFLASSEGRMKLIVLDEVDNIHKQEDRGGEGALIRIIRKKPKQPMLLIANDPYQLSAELRNLVEIITFKRLTKREIMKVLQKICEVEKIAADAKALEAIAENAGGDLRAAINDLQAIAEGKRKISMEDVVIGKRTQETDVFKVMQKIFKTNLAAVYSEAMLLDESPEELISWIDENVPLEYSEKDLLAAYLLLSRADIFLSRVKKRQYYRLWKYATYLMTVGVQQVKENPKKGFTKYQRPKNWQELARIREEREKYRKILEKIGKYSHISISKAKSELYPYIKTLINNLELEKAARIAAFYNLSQEELEFLDKDRAKEIWKIIEENNLHRIEDESFLSSLSKIQENKKIEETIVEDTEEGRDTEIEKEVVKTEKKESTKVKKRKKSGKDLTLDSFFS